MELQSKLLRVLQEREVCPLGSHDAVPVDLRLVSMTHRDLKRKIKMGEFREDLYYRIAHHVITIPPLRDRKEDIPELINYFTRKYCTQIGKSIKGFSIKARDILTAYLWPGNVRELENQVKRLIDLTVEGGIVDHDNISVQIKSEEPGDVAPCPGNLDERFTQDYEKKLIIQMLAKYGWNKSKTARHMNMTYRGLHEKMKRLGISREKKKDE